MRLALAVSRWVLRLVATDTGTGRRCGASPTRLATPRCRAGQDTLGQVWPAGATATSARRGSPDVRGARGACALYLCRGGNLSTAHGGGVSR